MAFDESLLIRMREALVELGLTKAEEKFMFGGMCFMVRGHMCVGIAKNDLMCRVGVEAHQKLADEPGCRPMDFTGRAMKGYLFVSSDVLQKKSDLKFWLQHCINFNNTLKQR